MATMMRFNLMSPSRYEREFVFINMDHVRELKPIYSSGGCDLTMMDGTKLLLEEDPDWIFERLQNKEYIIGQGESEDN